ncbi:MAG: class I SAM-dependent methyltransferase [Legionellaceae bacterium]|nr:class I SAM-dependent methyltransferase [Legionellaceae bacterium]
MQEINLLRSLPNAKRNIQARQEAKDPEVVRIAKQFGEMYFDGPRTHGYGGYYYDGRWVPVAKDIIQHFNLKAGHRVLDVGCAKGFLVKDLMNACPGLEVYGLDISEYALKNCEPEVIGRLHLGSADDLPFPDNSFDAVISLNTIHNFSRDKAVNALSEVQRVTKEQSFIQVDSYYTPEQKALFEDWVLTAEFHDYPEKWLDAFKEAGYKGDYYWTVLEN